MNRLIIAEMGIAHLGDIMIAKKMILVAKMVGADIIKTQLYDVDALFPDKKVMAQGKNWYDVVKKCQLPQWQLDELANFADRVGLEFLASAFDLRR